MSEGSKVPKVVLRRRQGKVDTLATSHLLVVWLHILVKLLEEAIPPAAAPSVTKNRDGKILGTKRVTRVLLVYTNIFKAF